MFTYLSKAITYLLLVYLVTISFSQAQSFTFADTHPVNNPDSLENWIKAHAKAPALLRLKSLITLERTYVWVNKNKIGSHFPALKKLVHTQSDPVARGAFHYLQAERYLYEHRFVLFVEQASLAIQAFASRRDTSGLIHAHTVLVGFNARTFGAWMQDTAYVAAKDHLNEAENLLKPGQPHDRLMYLYWRSRYSYGMTGHPYFKPFINQALAISRQQPEGQYARLAFLKMEAALYALEAQHQRAYELNKELIGKLQPDQPYERAGVLYNMSINCKVLGHDDEVRQKLDLCIAACRQCVPIFEQMLASAYGLLRKTYVERNDFKKANQLADSVIFYEIKHLTREMDINQSGKDDRYALKRRLQENQLLRQKQEATQFQNRIYTIILGVAVIIIGLITFLGIRLRKANAQLSRLLHERQQTNTQLANALLEVQQLNKTREYFISIIAHDMRKPLIYFRGLADLINGLLKQRAYQDIEVISHTIDSAGLDLEIMLDNLFTWAVGQREALPYYPQALPLAPILKKVAGVFQQLTHFQGKTITINCPDTLVVWADPNGLELIIRNLIDNALKYIDTAGNIQISAHEQPTNTILLSIEDNGQGIEPTKLAFLQGVLSGQTPAQAGENGLGMGLLLIRDFTIRNQGRVTIDSERGKGTQLTVVLPAAR